MTGSSPSAPPLDPECAAALQALPEALLRPLLPENIGALRDAVSQIGDIDLSRDGAVRVQEVLIPGPERAPDLPTLVLRPAAGEGPWPGLYLTHGGAFVSGDYRPGPGPFLDWVVELGMVAVSVNYRLAPENPHPAPVEDCYAGLVWTAENAAELGIDPKRMIIAGISTGGGLAAATALLTRDRAGPALSHQILLCPMLDDREITVSSTFEGIPWDRTSNRTAWNALLGPRDAADQRLVPMRHPPEHKTSAVYRPHSSMSERRRSIATKRLTTQHGWPRLAFQLNCMYGAESFTDSMVWRLTRNCLEPLALPKRATSVEPWDFRQIRDNE